MRNAHAVWAFVTALLALGALAGGAAAARLLDEVGLVEAVPAVPVAGILALVSLSLARRARARHARTLGRSGGRLLAALARFLGGLALLLALTVALALIVFAVLTYAYD